MVTSTEPNDVLALIERHQGRRGSIIAILEDIQASYNYLPKEALEIVARKTDRSLVDLYALATFYTSFSLEPRGEHLVSICVGTACHVRGAPKVLDECERTLEVRAGQTTEDRSFTLTTVNCLGACALGPVAVMDGEYHRNVKQSSVPGMITACRKAGHYGPLIELDEALVLHALCPSCNRSLMTTEQMLDGFPMIQVSVAFGDKHGWMRLSSVWGDNRIFSEHEIPLETLVHFFCPRCHAALRSTTTCAKCEAPTIPLLNKGGGIIKLCARRGCTEHMFDLG